MDSNRINPQAWSSDATIRKLELWVAILLSGAAILLHVLRMLYAGGLWRDEAATAHLASHFSFSYVVANSQYELFPVLFPALLHVYSWVAGSGDLALRIFGMGVGGLLLAVLWWDMKIIRRSFPMLSLALVGFNGAFIRWGDEVRGYGLGMVFLLLTVGLGWQALENPTVWRVTVAMVSAVASVQCLFNNASLLLAVCVGLMALALLRGSRRRAVQALLLGIPAALSLLPYIQPLSKVRDWDMIIRVPTNLATLVLTMIGLLAAPGLWVALCWVLLFIVILVVCFKSQLKDNPLQLNSDQRHVLAFCGMGMLLGMMAYFALLMRVGYGTAFWYYLPLAAFIAVFLDVASDTLRRPRARLARIAVAVGIALISFPPTIQQSHLRQTNVDLVAWKLAQTARPQDLIIVTPWYNGVSFDRYYSGSAPWMTVPLMNFHKFHRFDLVKPQMMFPDIRMPIQPIIDKITETLKAGNRVWVTGAASFLNSDTPVPRLGPAPDPQWGWYVGVYHLAWSVHINVVLEEHSTNSEVIAVSSAGAVSPFEDLSLKCFKGWSGL